MNHRIKGLIDSLGIKKVMFARELNISQSYVSDLCSGKTRPSDRTIVDICRRFNVNETWLRTGEGEMFLQLSRSEEIAAFVGDVLSGTQDDFRRRFISVLSKLDVEEWKLLEKMANKLVEDLAGKGENKTADP